MVLADEILKSCGELFSLLQDFVFDFIENILYGIFLFTFMALFFSFFVEESVVSIFNHVLCSMIL